VEEYIDLMKFIIIRHIIDTIQGKIAITMMNDKKSGEPVTDFNAA